MLQIINTKVGVDCDTQKDGDKKILSENKVHDKGAGVEGTMDYSKFDELTVIICTHAYICVKCAQMMYIIYIDIIIACMCVCHMYIMYIYDNWE